MRITTLKEIIDEKLLQPVFQPIFDLTVPEVTGYEALIRGPKDSIFYNPKNLFDEAKNNNLIVPLEYLCLEIACREFKEKKIQGKLFVNISPMSLIKGNAQKHIVEILQDELSLDREKVVIELSEKYPVDDYALISAGIRYLRDSGYELAIDDLGAGYSSLRVWSEFSPEYVKIDRHFIDSINHDPVKYEFVRSIQEISRSLGCKVIAEGIETEDELKSIRALGITHGQGFLLGKPDLMPIEVLPLELNNILNPLRQVIYHRCGESVADLMEYAKPFSIDDKLEYIADKMRENTAMDSIPVIKKGNPIGVITRKKIFELFLGRYGRELHAKKSVKQFVDTNVLVVDKHSSLSDVSRRFTSSNQLDMNIDIIITDGNKYIGVVKTKKLLQKITEQRIMSARHSNPLSMLPGNVPIYEWIDDLLDRKQNFKLAYFDLNDFKPYNDIYGYTRGDEVILLLAEIIKENIDPDLDRVGHIGGDDFVIIFQSRDWEQRCQNMLVRFDEEIKGFYNDHDLRNQGIHSYDRRGENRFFSILSVAIGIVEPDWRSCQSHHDVAAIATDAKHEAKKLTGNKLFLSRRRGPTQIFDYVDNYGA